jgi:hypothetical protein
MGSKSKRRPPKISPAPTFDKNSIETMKRQKLFTPVDSAKLKLLFQQFLKDSHQENLIPVGI